MDLGEELWAAQKVASFWPTPDGPRWVRVITRLRAELPRFEKDVPPVYAFVVDVLPVIQKHWPMMGPAINDMLPLIEALLLDWKGETK